MSSTIITILALTVATGGDAFVSTVRHPTQSTTSQTSLFAKGKCILLLIYTISDWYTILMTHI